MSNNENKDKLEPFVEVYISIEEAGDHFIVRFADKRFGYLGPYLGKAGHFGGAAWSEKVHRYDREVIIRKLKALFDLIELALDAQSRTWCYREVQQLQVGDEEQQVGDEEQGNG